LPTFGVWQPTPTALEEPVKSTIFSLWLAAIAAWLTIACGGGTAFRGDGKQEKERSIDAEGRKQLLLMQAPAESFVDKFANLGDGIEINESFTYTQTPQLLDIVLVVDNSNSMQQEQTNLSTKIAPLLSKVAQSDWQIAVTSTDFYRPACERLFNKQTANLATVFANTIKNLGINGDGVEIGFYKAVQALSNTCQGQDWVRPNSTVVVLIVSDEDNCSNTLDTTNCRGTGAKDASYILNYLAQIRELGRTARMYGIISPPENPCATADNTGFVYAEAIKATQGFYGSICDASYENTLAAISENISSILAPSFRLKQRPLSESMRVRLNGKEIDPKDIEVIGSEVYIKGGLANNAAVSIAYVSDVGSSAPEELKLSKPAKLEGIRVSVGGTPLNKDLFTYDHVKQSIVFATPPPLGEEVVASYDADIALTDKFTLEEALDAEEIECHINASVVECSYDSAENAIVFPVAPPLGSIITVYY
jgi:hypothetical protein